MAPVSSSLPHVMRAGLHTIMILSVLPTHGLVLLSRSFCPATGRCAASTGAPSLYHMHTSSPFAKMLGDCCVGGVGAVVCSPAPCITFLVYLQRFGVLGF